MISDEASRQAVFVPVYKLDGSGNFMSSCGEEDFPYAVKYNEVENQ